MLASSATAGLMRAARRGARAAIDARLGRAARRKAEVLRRPGGPVAAATARTRRLARVGRRAVRRADGLTGMQKFGVSGPLAGAATPAAGHPARVSGPTAVAATAAAGQRARVSGPTAVAATAAAGHPARVGGLTARASGPPAVAATRAAGRRNRASAPTARASGLPAVAATPAAGQPARASGPTAVAATPAAGRRARASGPTAAAATPAAGRPQVGVLDRTTRPDRPARGVPAVRGRRRAGRPRRDPGALAPTPGRIPRATSLTAVPARPDDQGGRRREPTGHAPRARIAERGTGMPRGAVTSGGGRVVAMTDRRGSHRVLASPPRPTSRRRRRGWTCANCREAFAPSCGASPLSWPRWWAPIC
jgi:hypothetical protein